MPIHTKKVFKKKKKTSKCKPTLSVKTGVVKQASTKKKKLKIKNRRLLKKGRELKCDNGIGIHRLLAHFNKFYKKSPLSAPLRSNMVLNKVKTGLTPKERNYVICSCQQRPSRYGRLKMLAAEAERNKKIFLMSSPNKAITNALTERGWIEKIPPTRMDLSTIRNKKYDDDSEIHLALERLLLSNLVEKSLPSFIWDLRDEWGSDRLCQNHKVIHNNHRSAALWSTKQGLCSSVRNNQWYYIEEVADAVCPRTYNNFDESEKEEFESDYKLTACTNLLKWILSMVAKGQKIFVDSGTIGHNVIVFALNRCKEYLFQKQNKDIDTPSRNTPFSQWNAFLKKYYILIAKQDKFKPDKDNKLSMYLGYAKFMIKEIHKYRPQLSCEGCHNIWIIKPTHCSRGRGIRLASKFAVLNDLLHRGRYVFQKYVEESMLIYDTKFDVRQYYLVTSTFPLVIWMYQDCYLKFSSQKYNLKNFHESIHLTNNAVQKKYKNCINRHPELPQNNMWSLNTFKEYLTKFNQENVWDTIIYPGMKKSIIGIMLSCQESTSNWKNRFEIYGCDFLLDKNYKPWLIEINSGPDFNPTTEVTAEICPAVLSDVIKVVIDRAADPKASTGKFECIYKQNVYMRPCGRVDDLLVEGVALPRDYFCNDAPQMDESYSFSHSEKQRDVSFMLKKLKISFDTGTNKKENQNEGTGTVDQLDSVLDRMTTDESRFTSHSHYKNKIIISPTESCASSNNFRQFADNNSVADMTQFIPQHSTNNKQFSFSNLDDGPLGKGSELILSDPAGKKSLQSLSSKQNTKFVKFEGQPEQKDKEDKNNFEPEQNDKENIEHKSSVELEKNFDDQFVNYEQFFSESTKKVFSFLDRKQKEYVKDL